MANNPLVRDWIQYLKNNQIASSKSNPETGKLNYKRSPTTEDLKKFLSISGTFSDEQISNAIDTVLSKKPKSAPVASPPEQPPVSTPSTYDTEAGKVKSEPGNRQRGDIIQSGQNQLQWTGQPGKEWFIANGPLSKPDSHTDRISRVQTIGGKRFISADDAKRILHATESFDIGKTFLEYLEEAKSGGRVAGAPPSMTPNAVRKREQRAAQKTTNTSTQVPPQQGGSVTDINGSDLDENDVAQILSILNKISNTPVLSKKEPAAPPESAPAEDPEKNAERLRKIKRVVRDTMTPAQRKSLWRALNDDTVTESEITRADTKAALQGAADLRNNAGLLKRLPGLRKDKVNVNDLQKAWQDAKYPDDTRDISAILKKFGFGDSEIKKVFAKVFGEEDSEDGYNNPVASNAIQNIADYAKQYGIADELKAFLKDEFGEELGLNDKQGILSKAANYGRKLFGKKAVTEEVRQIFTLIIQEERLDRYNLIKEQDKVYLGRNRK